MKSEGLSWGRKLQFEAVLEKEVEQEICYNIAWIGWYLGRNAMRENHGLFVQYKTTEDRQRSNEKRANESIHMSTLKCDKPGIETKKAFSI